MTRVARSLFLLSALGLLASLTGCSFFGTHEGFEDGDVPRWAVAGMASYEMVGIAPAVANEGDEVTVFLASELDAPVDAFQVADFWFCTFDGEAAMLETGGNEYEADVDTEVAIDQIADISISLDELDDSVISTVSFTVPDGTVTGEGFVITPSDAMEWFLLGIQ
ncbi:MAG: hypothetical protein VX498_15255 [Myxococcota bacterium]|nr:hypothetical protein [Myxococcota bacterium]